MTFAKPIWLLVGIVASLVIVVLQFRLGRLRTRGLAGFCSPTLVARLTASVSRPRRFIKQLLTVLGVFLVTASLARPQRGFRLEETKRQGVDLLFAIDTSKSMLATDVKPDRLSRAKLAVQDLVAKFDGDRVGLVAFAGDAFLQAPLTLDREMFADSLAALDTTIIARGGTDIGRAIEVSTAALASESANQKILILLTDGEDLEGKALDAAQAAGKAGVKIFPVGIGTAPGELIPTEHGMLKDDAGNFVRSHLDEKALQAIAAATGGQYRSLGVANSGLASLYADVLQRLPKQEHESHLQRVPIERFSWTLGLAIGCLALEALLRDRKKMQPLRTAVAMALGVIFLPIAAHASAQTAEAAYKQGHYAKSAADYEAAVKRSPKDERLKYNLGVSAYKNADYDKAASALGSTMKSAKVDLQETSYYDLGNVQYRTGQKTEQDNVEQTKAKWREAIASYESALKLNATDADARFNLEFVKKKLAALEEKQKQEQKQQKQNDKQQSAKNQDKKAGKQGAQNPQQGGDQQKDAQNPQPKNGEQQANQQGQKPSPAQTSGGGAQQASTEPPTAPGQMSKGDAEALLDSLRGQDADRRMSALQNHKPTTDESPAKDW